MIRSARRKLVGLIMAIGLTSACDADRVGRPSDSLSPRVAFDPYDPIYVAINDIGNVCPDMADWLMDVYNDGGVTLVPWLPNGWWGQTTYSVDTLTSFRIDDGQESIQLGDWYATDPAMMVYMLRHEYGHAYGWATDNANGQNGYETSCTG
jgi:hypothetical protein